MKMTNNNDYTLKDVNREVELFGWVQKKRNLGGLIFIDLRDRSGIIQLVVRPEDMDYEVALSLKNESVIRAYGSITERESKNTKIPTGEIEVLVSELELINQAHDVPFEISIDTSALEDTRLKYRYLDIRRSSIKDNLILRHKVVLLIRNFLSEKGFIEVETPILCKSTPEGARDYLVPSRIFNGRFYALPQSPQLYKQLLMIGGMEKYFQIARCFRDEDLRADRQPEFTQVDIEMSFVKEEDVWSVVEDLMRKVFKEIKNVDLDPFIKLTYNECIDRFGIDKPDMRFGMEIEDISDIFSNTEFEIYKNVLSSNGIINCLVAKNAAERYSRKEIDNLQEIAKVYKAKVLSYLKYSNNELSGSIIKVMSDTEKTNLINRLGLEENDLVLILADNKRVVKTAFGEIRNRLGKALGLRDNSSYKFLWVTDFPMFEYSEEEGRFVAQHHPFTSPKLEDVDKLLSDKANCYSRAYDLVLNGYELLSGSIRIHDPKIQAKVFEAIGMTLEEAKAKFGFFLEAFNYGTPPHGGVGIGLERVIMILADTDNIRDVVAFPKTASASCLMSEAPDSVSKRQLDDLGIKLKEGNE